MTTTVNHAGYSKRSVRLTMLAVVLAGAVGVSACETDGTTPNCPDDANDEGILDPGNPCLTQTGDALAAIPIDAGTD